MNKNMSQSGIVFNLQRYSVHDGPGIRMTVFLKGCPLSCWWCHNPESQQIQPETIKKNLKLDSDTQICEAETIGKTMTVSEVMREIKKEVIFFDESGGGVTFSGGEPLMQPQFLKAVLEQCREQEIHTALDTTGYASAETFQSIIDHVQLFLYDLKLIDDRAHRQYTGVSNKFPLDNLQRLAERGKNIWIRFPVIPTVTDTEENIKDVLHIVTHLKGIQQVNLLPYHRIADGKYQKLHQENRMGEIEPPSDERMEALQYQFEQHGLKVKIGG